MTIVKKAKMNDRRTEIFWFLSRPIDGISEKEFIRWIKMMPAETIGSILEFSVIPPELKPQEEDQLSPQPSVSLELLLFKATPFYYFFLLIMQQGKAWCHTV